MKAKHKKRKKGRLLMALGLLLIAAALCLSVYNYLDGERAGKEAQDKVDQIKEVIDEQMKEQEDSVPDYYKDYDEMPTEEINGYKYIGLLEIPSLNLTLPVMEEWDYKRLNIAPCRYTGSYLTNDMVIAGHNYVSHFAPLGRIELGSDVYFINVEGVVYHYYVVNTEVIQPTQVEEMTTGDWDLSLFTCTASGRTRFTVRCEREE